MLEINNVMKKIIGLVIGLVVIGLIALASPSPKTPLLPPTNTATTTPNTETTNKPTTQPSGKKAGFSRADVAKHNNENDCYTIVGDKVYGLTTWINEHPGGAEAIISLCGIDGTADFEAQHGSSGKAQRVLESYFVGQLVN